MKELKTETMKIVNQINQDWVDTIKDGEKEGGIDLTKMFGKFSAQMEKLDNAFKEAELRNKPKSLFGGLGK